FLTGNTGIQRVALTHTRFSDARVRGARSTRQAQGHRLTKRTRSDNKRRYPMKRRSFLELSAASAVAIAAPSIVRAQPRSKLKVGYLHTLAVDGQLWLADSM